MQILVGLYRTKNEKTNFKTKMRLKTKERKKNGRRKIFQKEEGT